MTWVPLYGRWRYRFEPHIYLGLALSHLADCFTSCTELCTAVDQRFADPPPGAGQACTAAWGALPESFKPSSAGRSPCWRGRCVELSPEARRRFFPATLACPAVDWFTLLRQIAFPLDAAGSRGGGSDCEEVSTSDKWFWQVLLRRVSDHQHTCEEMREELVSVVELCTEKPR